MIEREDLIKFGCITDAYFHLKGSFPVNILTPFPEEYLNEIKKENYWVYAESPTDKRFGQKTNALMSGMQSRPHGEFMVQCLSFLYGQKLFTRPCEYVGSVQLQSHNLGFTMSRSDLEKSLEYCNILWEKSNRFNNSERIKKRIFGIVHLLFMSKDKTLLQFVRFMYLYIALDACYRHFVDIAIIPSEKGITHEKRLDKLSEIADFSFSEVFIKKAVYKLRNDVFHEGIYLNEPLGYSCVHGDMYKLLDALNIEYDAEKKLPNKKVNMLSLESFLIKVIFSVLEIKAEGFLPADSLNKALIKIY